MIEDINKNKYKFVKYSKKYPKLFDIEKNNILRNINEKIDVQHVGSSSIPGLGGKGIIDIAILTPKSKLRKYMVGLEKAGFSGTPKHPTDKRRAFMHKIIIEKGKQRRVHVHLALTKKFYNSFIAFRNYMRENKSLVHEYNKIKKKAVKIAKGDGSIYHNKKKDFVERISRRAMQRSNL